MDSVRFKLMEERLFRIETKVDKAVELLTGNGSPKKGLLIQVDRHGQILKALSWFIVALVGSCVTLLIKLLS